MKFLWIFIPFLLVTCAAHQADTTATQLTNPPCVWNAAYQQNDGPKDDLGTISAEAVNCYILFDLFDQPEAISHLPPLKSQGNLIGCYISVGTCEDWRDDFDQIRRYCTPTPWSVWEQEYLVTDPDGIQPWMEARIDRMSELGCDFIELDNMDFATENENYSLNVSLEKAEVYANQLCQYIHLKGMRCMAKNSPIGEAQIFDGGTFESTRKTRKNWNSSNIQSFSNTDRPTIIMHYEEKNCSRARGNYPSQIPTTTALLCQNSATRVYVHQ